MSKQFSDYSYQELCAFDTVKVELMPKKKGIILKHVEYEVSSQRTKVTVQRRYSDFVELHELISARFPYRVIPRLPPKKVGASKEFIEHRKKCLQRYMTVVCRHPWMYNDKILMFFLTFSGKDVKLKLREYYRHVPDEFMTSDVASQLGSLVPVDAQLQFSTSKEHFKMVYDSLSVLKDVAEKIVRRLTSFAADMSEMSNQFGNLSNNATSLASWTTGASQVWPQLQNGLKLLSPEFTSLIDVTKQSASDEQDGVVERLSFFQDLIMAYRDLCDRHEKGVLSDHQRAFQKLEQYKRRKTGAAQGSEAANCEEMERTVLEQEHHIISTENRSLYFMYCLQAETQFVHAHLDILRESLSCLAQVETTLNSDLSRIWTSMTPIIAGLSSSSLPPSTKRLTPLGSPTSNKLSAFEI